MPTFLEMLRNPAWQQGAFGALGAASGNPYVNPILAFATGGQQAYQQDLALQEERRKQEAAEAEKRRQEEHRRKLQLLDLGRLGADPKNRGVIEELFPEVAGTFGEQWGAADREAGRALQAAAAAERAEAEAEASRVASLGGARDTLEGDAATVFDALMLSGNFKDAATLAKNHARPQASAAPKSPWKYFSSGGHRYRYNASTGERKRISPDKPDTSDQVRQRLADQIFRSMVSTQNAKIRTFGMRSEDAKSPTELAEEAWTEAGVLMQSRGMEKEGKPGTAGFESMRSVSPPAGVPQATLDTAKAMKESGKSHQEIRDAMVEAGAPPTTADRVISWLEAQ